MDPAAALGMLLSHHRSLSGDAAIQHKAANKSLAESDHAQKHQRSRSWLSPHRRQSSAGSSTVRRACSPLRTSSLPVRPPPPSRGSYASDEASSFSSKALSNRSSGVTTIESSEPSPPPPPPPPPPCPPKRPERPERPREGLFDGLFNGVVVDEANEEAENDSGLGKSIMRPFRAVPCLASASASASDPGNQSRQPQDKDRHKPKDPLQANSRAKTSGIRQPSMEADLACEGIGAALSKTKTASSDASVYSDPSAPPPIVPSRPSHRTNSRSQRQVASLDSRHQARSSVWTLTDNVADMFKAQRSKTVRKPMTPARIEAIWNGQDNSRASPNRTERGKLTKEAPASPKSTEPCTKAAAETLRLEPFHHAFTTLRSPMPADAAAAAAGARLSRARAIPFEIAIPPPPSSVLFSQEIVHYDISLQRSPPPKLEQEKEEPDLDADSVNDGASSEDPFPLTPPPKNPARFAARSPETMPPLAPIPEVSRAATPDVVSTKAKPSSVRRRSMSFNQVAEMNKDKDERVYFKSTPFTLTNPGFRHGPIIFQKSDIGRDSVTTETLEEDVDWAAFQTAILGGAGGDLHEIFPEQKTETVDDEGNMADEVTAWFEEFGFETHGELIASDKSSSQRDSASSSPSTAHTDSEGELRTPASASSKGQHVFDTIKLLRGRCNSIWTAEKEDSDSSWGQAVAGGEAGEGVKWNNSKWAA